MSISIFDATFDRRQSRPITLSQETFDNTTRLLGRHRPFFMYFGSNFCIVAASERSNPFHKSFSIVPWSDNDLCTQIWPCLSPIHPFSVYFNWLHGIYIHFCMTCFWAHDRHTSIIYPIQHLAYSHPPRSVFRRTLFQLLDWVFPTSRRLHHCTFFYSVCIVDASTKHYGSKKPLTTQ